LEVPSTTTAFFAPLGHRGVGAIDVDTLLRQLPGQFRECAGLVRQFNLLQRAFGVRESRPAQSLLGFVDVVHQNLHRSLRYCRAAQKSQDVHLRIGENVDNLLAG